MQFAQSNTLCGLKRTISAAERPVLSILRGRNTAVGGGWALRSLPSQHGVVLVQTALQLYHHMRALEDQSSQHPKEITAGSYIAQQLGLQRTSWPTRCQLPGVVYLPKVTELGST